MLSPHSVCLKRSGIFLNRASKARRVIKITQHTAYNAESNKTQCAYRDIQQFHVSSQNMSQNIFHQNIFMYDPCFYNEDMTHGTSKPFLHLSQQREKRRVFMFILVTPIRRRGADSPNPGVTGLSHRRSESSSCSSRPNVASLSIRRCRWHVCSIFSLLISPRRRMS